MITGFKDDEIILQLVEEKTQLETKCKELESKLRGKNFDDNFWNIAYISLIGVISGLFFASFFCFRTYQDGYQSATEKYQKIICAGKHPKSVSAFTKCVEKGE